MEQRIHSNLFLFRVLSRCQPFSVLITRPFWPLASSCHDRYFALAVNPVLIA